MAMKIAHPPPRPWVGSAAAAYPADSARQRALVHEIALTLPFGRASPGNADPLAAAAALGPIITQLRGSLDQDFAGYAISRPLWAGPGSRIAGRSMVL
jgi:hypothetical protein